MLNLFILKEQPTIRLIIFRVQSPFLIIKIGISGFKGGQVTAKGIEKFILDWLNKVTNDDSEFQKISSSKAVEKDKKRIKEVQSKKSELLGNKKATEHKLNNIMNIIESNSAPKSLLK